MKEEKSCYFHCLVSGNFLTKLTIKWEKLMQPTKPGRKYDYVYRSAECHVLCSHWSQFRFWTHIHTRAPCIIRNCQTASFFSFLSFFYQSKRILQLNYFLILFNPFLLLFRKYPFKISAAITLPKNSKCTYFCLELIILRETLQIQ